jgi:hypothetical protein
MGIGRTEEGREIPCIARGMASITSIGTSGYVTCWLTHCLGTVVAGSANSGHGRGLVRVGDTHKSSVIAGVGFGMALVTSLRCGDMNHRLAFCLSTIVTSRTTTYNHACVVV